MLDRLALVVWIGIPSNGSFRNDLTRVVDCMGKLDLRPDAIPVNFANSRTSRRCDWDRPARARVADDCHRALDDSDRAAHDIFRVIDALDVAVVFFGCANSNIRPF